MCIMLISTELLNTYLHKNFDHLSKNVSLIFYKSEKLLLCKVISRISMSQVFLTVFVEGDDFARTRTLSSNVCAIERAFDDRTIELCILSKSYSEAIIYL